MSQPSIPDLIHNIDGRLADIQREISSLEAARAALSGNGSAAAPLKPGRLHRAKPAPNTGVVAAGKLQAILAENPALTTSALAKLANAAPPQVLVLLREMELAGTVRRSGQRRGTRWHAV